MRGEAASSRPSATAGAGSVRIFECARLPPEPWANGNGITRTIARGCVSGRSDDVDWRVSLATLNTSAWFSQFGGFDRSFLLVDEGVVDLHSQDGQLVARRGQPVQFSGDLHVWSTLSAKPVNVLNVMTRRGRCHSSVNIISSSSRISSASVQLLIGLSGQWTVRSTLLNSISLGRLQGIFIEERGEPLDLSPVGPDSELVSIAIESPSL